MPESRPAAAAGAQRRIVERPAPEIGSELSKSLSPRMAQIYSARGIDSMAQLDLTLAALLLPRELDGAAHAAGLLADAVTAGRHIRFVGDFDADGATSSVVGVAALRAMGCAAREFHRAEPIRIRLRARRPRSWRSQWPTNPTYW